MASSQTVTSDSWEETGDVTNVVGVIIIVGVIVVIIIGGVVDNGVAFKARASSLCWRSTLEGIERGSGNGGEAGSVVTADDGC